MGLMDRPCTHGSLDGEQGWLEGLVVQTQGGHAQAKHAPRASQTRTMRALRMSQTGTVQAPRASQTGTAGEPRAHQAYVDYGAGTDGG